MALTQTDIERRCLELGQRVERSFAPPPSFVEFARQTVPWDLDPWQVHLCERLGKLDKQKKQRLLISAPPQWGKSIFVSQRLPAWLLGVDPAHRVRLACYNLDHSTKFSKVLINLMRDEQYERLFPTVVLPNQLTQEEWYTPQRAALLDAQPSFKALGLATGFVGTGADLLIIDDPYASAQEAYSQVVRENVWTFWNDTARVRVGSGNVVVMFHRYHEDDLAGRLLEQDDWEVLNYAAVCEDPETDPLGRAEGEILSPRFEQSYIDQQRSESPSAFLSQFQGRPVAAGGGAIQRSWFKIAAPSEVPPGLRMGLGVDPAVSSKKTADFTVAFPGGVTDEGEFYLFNPYRQRAEWSDTRKNIIGKAVSCGAQIVGIETVAAQKVMFVDLQGDLARYAIGIVAVPATTDKLARASFWLPIAEQGRMYLVDDGSGWVETFLREAEVFPRGRHDDQIDGVTCLMNALGARTHNTKSRVINRLGFARR